MTRHIYVVIARRKTGGDWFETNRWFHDKAGAKDYAARGNNAPGNYEYRVKAKGVSS